GDTLLRIESGHLEASAREMGAQLASVRAAIRDLEGLLRADSDSQPGTDVYRYSAVQFAAALERASNAARSKSSDAARWEALGARGLVPAAEAEALRTEAEAAQTDVQRLKAAQRLEWAQQLEAARARAAQLAEQRGRLESEIASLTI